MTELTEALEKLRIERDSCIDRSMLDVRVLDGTPYLPNTQEVTVPPKPRDFDTVFSSVYQCEVPRELYPAIESLEVGAGRAILRIHEIIKDVGDLSRRGHSPELEENLVKSRHQELGKYIPAALPAAFIDAAATELEMVRDPSIGRIAHLFQDANRRYEASLRGKSTLEESIWR